MSLLFPYKRVPIGRLVASLGGRSIRPRPLIPITLIGPSRGAVREGLVDSGSDDTVFPESLAGYLGVDLSLAPGGSGVGVGARSITLRYAELTLRLATGNERREWKAWVGFTPAHLQRPILGFAGFLQFFTATFDGEREQLELAVNNLYPGT